MHVYFQNTATDSTAGVGRTSSDAAGAMGATKSQIDANAAAEEARLRGEGGRTLKILS